MSEVSDFIAKQLTEMGFPAAKVKKAISQTKATSVEQAMEWLITHENDTGEETPAPAAELSSGNVLKLRDSEPTPGAEPAGTDVGKTPEEIEEAKRRADELIKKRRVEREEKEKQEELEREINRRKSGSEIVRLKEKMENEERLRAAEDRRREKIEAEVQKKKVLEQIKADREAFKRRNDPNHQDKKADEAPKPAVAAPMTPVSYDNCRLAIRLPDGTQLIHEFKAKEQLAAVRLYVELNRTDELPLGASKGDFTMHMPPQKPFSEEDMHRPLDSLALCPSARIVVSQKKKL